MRRRASNKFYVSNSAPPFNRYPGMIDLHDLVLAPSDTLSTHYRAVEFYKLTVDEKDTARLPAA
jgi:hypothetical protein